jgi:hypothetical protein
MAVRIDSLFQFPFQTTSATCASSLEQRILGALMSLEERERGR